MKIFTRPFRSLLLVAIAVGALAYALHKHYAPAPAEPATAAAASAHPLDFYPPQIRTFLESNAAGAPALRAASLAADDAIAAAATRLKAAPPNSPEFDAARRAYLQAGLAKLDHVGRVATAFDKHTAEALRTPFTERKTTAAPAASETPAAASQPPETAPGFFAEIRSAIVTAISAIAAAITAIALVFAAVAALIVVAIVLLIRAIVRMFRKPSPRPAAHSAYAPAPAAPPALPVHGQSPATAQSASLFPRPDPASPRSFRLPLPTGAALDMLPVPAGSYTVGDGDKAFSVAIPHPFWLGKCEVTQAQWKAVMGAANNPSKHPGDRHPVENISHADVAAFCQKINQAETASGRLPRGYTYALPTEDEWCYAASAGNPHATATGWTADNSGGNTHNVGELPPNPWGFHDMVGNVAEMCADLAVGNLSGGTGTTLRSLREKHRITRGGDIAKRQTVTTHTYRDALVENTTAPEVGFRLALRKET